jgi:hypothetical protein
MPVRIPIGWYQHKPRVIRRDWTRTLATVSPDLGRYRGWLWTVDRVTLGIRVEFARGQCPLRRDAIFLANEVGSTYDAIFVDENRKRYR